VNKDIYNVHRHFATIPVPLSDSGCLRLATCRHRLPSGELERLIAC